MPRDQTPDSDLPIKLGPASNGEFVPRALGPVEQEAVRRTREEAERHARRLGVDRRAFLRTVGGAALMLGILAACNDEERRSRGERAGGTFDTPEDPADADAAAEALTGDELVFDVQTHYLNFDLAAAGGFAGLAASFPQAACGERDSRACFSVEHYLDLLFAQSDTAMTVLSAIPIPEPANPLAIEDMELALAMAEQLCGDGRVLLHGGVQPTMGAVGAQLDGMATLVRDHPIAGWKVYTHAPGPGWWLDDHDASAPQVGTDFLRRVAETGPRMVCVHKGLSGGSENASPVDIGPAAKAHPDIDFVVYHSGYESGTPEGPYAPTAPRGVDRLLASLEQAGIGPGENVYAELGSTWWLLMRDTTQAAHVLGKLLAHLGPDRIVWGTDSLWYGSPQDQIQAFRAFEILPELQEVHGYPALTPEVKRKILGENALALYGVDAPGGPCTFTADELAEARRMQPASWHTYGPSTSRELAALLGSHGALA
ncbi:MAG: amidohydrolase [Actinobacteria bacterium]|nr:amidohydrolase [Actinomycetota bacterium]